MGSSPTINARVTEDEKAEVRRRAVFWSFLDPAGEFPPSISAYIRHMVKLRPVPTPPRAMVDPELTEGLRNAGNRLNDITRALNRGDPQPFAAAAPEVFQDLTEHLQLILDALLEDLDLPGLLRSILPLAEAHPEQLSPDRIRRLLAKLEDAAGET